jgi:predicted methyltransferase
MKLLNEILNSNIRLSKIQQGVLAVIYSSSTSELAMEALSGTESLMNALDFLQKNGFVKYNSTQTILTDEGNNAVSSYNISENGELSDYGKELVNTVNKNTSVWKSTV